MVTLNLQRRRREWLETCTKSFFWLNPLKSTYELNRILGGVTDEHLETIAKESGSTTDGTVRVLTSERQAPATLDEVAEEEHGVLQAGWGSRQEPTPGNYNNHVSHSCSFERCFMNINCLKSKIAKINTR